MLTYVCTLYQIRKGDSGVGLVTDTKIFCLTPGQKFSSYHPLANTPFSFTCHYSITVAQKNVPMFACFE